MNNLPITGAEFWTALDHLVATSAIVIDRPAGSPHPQYPEMIYPVDYGYLEGTHASDGGGIDLWRGTGTGGVAGVLCTVDPVKRDAELKILYHCTPEEIEAIHRLLNIGMGALLCLRPV